jgi:Tfp pilus assembly protein PilZ
MKKSADLYKRSTVSKTGKLNMNTLHSYSYNEDIFLKMNVEPGATNHGLVMFMDWSGSMADNMYATIKQTLNLVWFCERVNIPFEVYGFTNGYSNRDDTMKNTKIQKSKQNDLIINELRLLNFLSSRSNKKDMQEGLTNLWALANYWAERYGQNKNRMSNDRLYSIYLHENYNLHSTPLNHSIVAAMDLVPKFKKDNGIQKVHTVFLTDGYSNPITNKYNWSMQDDRRPSDRYDSNDNPIPLPNDYQGHMTSVSTKSYYGSTGRTIITDSVNKKKFICTDDKFTYGNQTKVLLEFLKSREPNMTVTNFFIASSNKKGTISRNDIISIFGLNWSDEDKAKVIQKEIKKNNVAVCTNQGWDEMYVLPGGEKLDISDDDMSEIVPGVAKKSDLKRAFSKMTSGRKNSRPLLNKFIGMIA